jgi:hypothetical protein
MIVARDNASLYEYVSRQFSADRDSIEVVLDRRSGERRSATQTPSVERRHQVRRVRIVNDMLRTLGWALIRRYAVSDRLESADRGR